MRSGHPLRLPDPTSLPEPDLAAVAPGTRADEHPTSALLVTEIAVSSTRTDVDVKAPLYASAGVREYWVVDVPARCLHVFAEPDGHRYRQVEIV